MKYGKWEILESIGGGKCIAKCDCGTEKEQWIDNLRSGKSTQCTRCQGDSYKTRGIHYDIGGTSHPLYNVYQGIKRRCYNTKQKSYKWYGAKGVVMCDEWLNNYRLFYDWMVNNGYLDGMVISRKGDIGNYEPLNCKVITFSENSKEIKAKQYTNDEKHRLSLNKSGLSQEQFDDMIAKSTSGDYLSFEIVNEFNIDRHTIIGMLKRNGLSPLWRRGRYTNSEVSTIRERYEICYRRD